MAFSKFQMVLNNWWTFCLFYLMVKIDNPRNICVCDKGTFSFYYHSTALTYCNSVLWNNGNVRVIWLLFPSLGMLGFSEKHISFKTKNSKWRNIVIRTSYTCNSHWLNSACDADWVFVLTSVLEPQTCLDLECLCSLELGLTLEEDCFFIWCALVIYQKKFESQSHFYETLLNL